MAQNSADDKLYSVQFYRYDLLNWRLDELGISIHEVARLSGEKFETVRRVLQGVATNKKVYPVVKALGLDWEKVHDLDLEKIDFHLAVVNGCNGTAHSAG